MKKPDLTEQDPMNQEVSPPRWLTRLLLWFHPEETLEEVTGDLEELYVYRAQQSGKWRADLLYLLNVLSVLPPFVRKRKKEKSYYKLSILNPAMLRNYFKIAFRTITHNKAYSAINIMGLSIGLAAAMLIMLYTKDEISYDRFHTNNPNIHRIFFDSYNGQGGLEYRQGITGFLQGPKFMAGIPEIQHYVRYKAGWQNIKQGLDVKKQIVFEADPTFFSVFSFPFINGNPETALLNPRALVISEDVALKQFGTTNALGKIIYLKDAYGDNPKFEPYTVTGITKRCPQNSTIKFDLLLPLMVEKGIIEDKNNWSNISLNTFVLTQPNADIKTIERKMNQIYVTDAKDVIKEMAQTQGKSGYVKYGLQPLTDIHLNKALPPDNGLEDGSNPMFSYILSGIAIFILLIACINFVNLTVARSLKRAKEIGVRKAVGGGRKQLILQFLGESYLLCLIAFSFALLLVQVVLPTFNQLSNKALSLSYLFDSTLIGAYMSLFIITGLMAGFYPALVLSNYSPVKTLYNRFNLSGKGYLQKSLVILQFSIASFLVIGTMSIYSQFNYLINKDLGYNDKEVIIVEKPGLNRSEMSVWKEALLQNPNILAVAPKNGGTWFDAAKINGDTQLSFIYETIDASYFSTLKIPLIKGRNFSADFPSDSTESVLVNETFVKKAGWKEPLGQIINFHNDGNKKYKVIGVVKNYHFAGLNQQIGQQVFTMKPDNSYGKILLKIRPGTETASLNHVAKTFKKLFPLTPYSYWFMEEDNLARFGSEARWKQIMLFGAILTIFISCIGLFGLVTLSAERRTKEIGIRKVLGASVSSIVQLLSSDFLKMVAFSFVFAFPAAYYAVSEWLTNYPYRIEISAWLFVSTAVLAIMIALFTVSFQSIKAAMMNPVRSLKNE
ncbi:ABC transporter permease [Emticicia fontis]